MTLPRSIVTNVSDALQREWLVTNGIGGFAAGTVSQANTRRYHGVLIASLRPPVERVLMVSKIDASVTYHGQHSELACNEFVDGTIAPRGCQLLSSFRLEDQVPIWTYSIADAVLEQRIWMAHGKNTTYVRFTLSEANAGIDLTLTPLCTYRDYHAHTRGGWPLEVSPFPNGCRINAFPGALPFWISADRGEFRPGAAWYWHFRHRAESERGLDDREDLLCPGQFAARVNPGESVTLVVTAEKAESEAAPASWQRESKRRTSLLEAVPAGAPQWIERLTLAADQFLVSRVSPKAADGEGASVIAGYPWFGDWGRDTMIALPGLAIATGRTSQAATVLRTFAKYANQGMLPNRFPDGGEAPEYNTVDATLWYFHAVASYLAATGDHSLLRDIYGTLEDIIAWHVRGTRYSIHVDDADGLLYAGEPGSQLTWMDAKVGDRAATPRIGKPVEVNALWHFALANMAEWATFLNEPQSAARFSTAAEKVAGSFAKTFWYAQGRYLYDVVDGPDDPTDSQGRHVDATLRPNQIFAVSLGKGLLSAEQSRSVVDSCARELLTPVGLRSLARGDSRYAAQYLGNSTARDCIYHQGTVWSWLLGPFILAHYSVYRDYQHANTLLQAVAPHLEDACLGTISEIFDGDAPHSPRGAFAQAWSVGEILRTWHFLWNRK